MMLYLYRILETRHMAECQMDAQKMHRFLTGLVHQSRAEANLLYWLVPEQMILWVQSDIRPDECVDLQLVHEIPIENILKKKSIGDIITFYLTTVPIYRLDGKRHYLSDPVRQGKWLKRMMQERGLDLRNWELLSKTSESIHHHQDHGGFGSVTLYTFRLSGEIVDLDALLKAWRVGIGAERAYGGGLCILAKN
jgi:hypothetical protein